MHKQGDILLIPIPFTYLSSNKRRPVIVIKRFGRVNQDIIEKIKNKINDLLKG